MKSNFQKFCGPTNCPRAERLQVPMNSINTIPYPIIYFHCFAQHPFQRWHIVVPKQHLDFCCNLGKYYACQRCQKCFIKKNTHIYRCILKLFNPIHKTPAIIFPKFIKFYTEKQKKKTNVEIVCSHIIFVKKMVYILLICLKFVLGPTLYTFYIYVYKTKFVSLLLVFMVCH